MLEVFQAGGDIDAAGRVGTVGNTWLTDTASLGKRTRGPQRAVTFGVEFLRLGNLGDTTSTNVNLA